MSYKTLDPQDFLVSADSITAPCWTNYSNPILSLYTSSVQVNGTSGNYYLNVYNADPSTDTSSEIQFNIAYGNINGSGSLLYDSGISGLSPSRTVYGQFRNLIYGDENTQFSFSSVTPSQQDFYSITIDRARFKESFNPGSFFIKLKNGANQISLVDDSTVTTTSTYVGTSRVYQILSGSYSSNTNLTTPSSSNYTVSGSYGIIIPDEGLIILNPRALALAPGALGGIAASFNEYSSSEYAAGNYNYNINNRLVYNFISSSIYKVQKQYLHVISLLV